MAKKTRRRRKFGQFILILACRCKLLIDGLRRGAGRAAPIERKKIFVHIGTHKTGTTSIQNFMRRQSRQLKQCGILVPRSGTLTKRSGHHNIAWEIRSDPLLEPGCGGVDDLLIELRAARERVAVISSEDFEYLVRYPNELKQFHARLLSIGYDPVYLVFFRNKLDYMKSLFFELKKQEINHPIEWFEAEIRAHGRIVVYDDWYYEFDYERFMTKWKDAVGQEVVSFDYDSVCRTPGLLPFFFETIGASAEIIAASVNVPRHNVRKTA